MALTLKSSREDYMVADFLTYTERWQFSRRLNLERFAVARIGAAVYLPRQESGDPPTGRGQVSHA
jgi:hypothetical protein